ncbi:hypothetical protein [Arsenophonus nasoniae]|uniref:Uncharacterized protein n=1 Tax=Arsenophonus nasoniae TaxID=638 RepID=A0AA95GW90_9GAMM|nr:hypothetical protein [Arsenophonus nasoniae]WGM02260.1 hypothetical protein QE210_03915 [Arsenophonus nasoniae]
MFPISHLSTVFPAAFHNENDPPNMLLQRLISSSTHIQGESRLLPNGLTARDNFPLLFKIVLDPVNEQPEINGFLPSDDFETLYPMIGKQGETTIVAGNYDEIVRFVSHNKAYAIFAIAAFGLPAVSLKQNFDDPDTSAIALLFSKTGSLQRATNFDEIHILGPINPERVVLLHTPYSDLNTLQPEVVEKLSRTYEQVVNQYINSANNNTFDIWFNLYPQDEALSSRPITNEFTQQQMNNGNLARKVEYNNIPHHLLTQSTSQTDTLAEKETVKLVTPETSTERILLGAEGITNASGLKGVSEKYSLDLNTLKDYPQTNSTLSAKGKIFLAGKSNKLTPEILKTIMSLGPEEFTKAGGLSGISEKYKVNYTTLKNYFYANGTLTVRGKVLLGSKSNKLTPEILKTIMSLGKDGIANAGGLKRLSERYNVNYCTLNNYFNANGTLTVSGKNFLGDKPNKITPEILTEIISLGEDGIAKAGGLRGLSKQYNVKLGTLYNYIYKNGTLTVIGEAILSGKPNKITPEILTEIMSLGEDGIAKAGGLKGLSEQYSVSLETLKSYLNKNGSLTVRGKSFLGDKSYKITPEILTEIMSLGEEGIAKAGGLKGVSEQYNVRLGTLKNYLNQKRTLTVRGEAILGGKPNKLTPELLKTIVSLGEDGIAKAGGLKGLSEQYNVRLGTLKNYLNKKGTLTVRGEAILGGKPNKVSPEMLTEIMSLGAERIAKAGGLKGLSKQYKVNLATLNHYIDKNGRLTVMGKAFLGVESNKITREMLTEIISLGAKEIKKAGGRKGLSEEYKVNLSSLRSYLKKDGTLTVNGKSFLGIKPNKLTPEILTKIMSLGAEGIKKAGGLQGLSEKHNVNLSTLNSYLDKNGTLKVRGESFLARARQ